MRIDAHTDTPVALDADAIRAALLPATAHLLQSLQVFPQLDSTNRWLLQAGQCGDACLAEHQTAGRGRRGRQWQSPPGSNIYLSLRWCFGHPLQHAPLLSLVTGLAVAEALADCGIQGHGLKWPNDVVCPVAADPANRLTTPCLHKIGGILLESVGNLEQVVIGIGLNVNMLPENAAMIDQPWTSLRQMTDRLLERNTLAGALLNRLLTRLTAFPQLDMAQFVRDWQGWDVLVHRRVQVLAGNTRCTGLACGVDTQGQLRVRLDDGPIKSFFSADVSVRM